MSEVKQRKLPDMMVSPSKLSFQIHSPLFRLDTLSPTFTISLSGAHGVVGDTKTTGLDVSRTSSAMPGTPGRLNKAAAVSAVGLSPLPRGDDMPMTSKSTELQNRMIDEQLEMLGELFPKQLNRASQDKLPSASPDSISRVDEKTEKLSTSESSGFQNSPVSDTFALSSNWPKLPEEDGVASASQRTSSASEGPIHSEKPIAEDSPDLSASADKPLIQRRSLAPTLRVNTTESQRYATKELVLIRKMKEEGRIKAENKNKPARQSDPAGQRRIESGQETLKIPIKPDKAEMDASEAMSIKPSITDHIDNKETTKNLLKPKDRPMKARRNSADSMVSHIVWSAVVEKFSEMAQEIAGLEGNPEKISRHNGKSETAVSGEQSQNDTVPDSSALEPQDAKSLSAEPIQSDIDLQSPDSPDDTVKSPNDVQMDDAAAKALGAKSEPDLSGPSATSVTLLAVPLTKGSKSPATSSIMKQGSGTGLVDEGNVSDTPSGKGNKYKVIKLKRGRTVRVQSHHASVNVEGDYAAFLKKAIGKHEKDSDATSVKSGKSNRSGKSGAWSTKSGVENGCFRRGSMRSIKTGRTIATVGDVSIRDLSRGARFRHPNPFFSQQHGFRKIKAPHQAGPGLLRRKGSKIVRLSVFEGRSTQDTSMHAGYKRLSDDGETLGSTLARIQVDKRKASTPLIGELSFENDDPVRAPTKTHSSTKRLPEPATSSQAPLSSANLAAYAASAIGVSARSERGPTLAKLAYAASAYVSGSLNKPASHTNQSTVGYPFPPVPASLPPVPVVTMRGFTPKGSAANGLPPLPPVPGSVLSTSSVVSASRANILGAQMRGTQMLGASQSNISIASNKSAPSPKKSKMKQGNSQQSPYPASHSRKPSQPTSAKMPSALPMSRVEDNFISMTPARSEMSIKSARSSEREQWDRMPMQAQSQAQAYSHAVPSSVPARPVLPEEMRASYKMKNAMRSSTAPLPPLPIDAASVKPLPLRTSSGSQLSETQQSRLSINRPHRPLTVDTDVAREQARKQRLTKQLLEEQKQQLARMQGLDGNSASVQNRGSEASLRDLDAMQMPFGQSKQPSSRFETEEAPKTGSSFSGKMTAMFTPKRPARKDSAAELPVRVPRPPSAEPVDSSLTHFTTNNAIHRQSTTSTSGSSIQSKSKGMKIFGGFSKIRKGN